MHPLIWLALGVIIAIIARICVAVINPAGSIPRRRGHEETCHLAVFLGSGMLYSLYYTSPQRSLSSRWSQQRGPVTYVRTGFLAVYPEDVSGKRGGLTQRTKGRHVGAAQNCLHAISCKYCLLLPREYQLTATLAFDSTRESL